MVALVKDDECKPISELMHVNACAVIRRDGDRFHAIDLVADDSRILAQTMENKTMPLVHQIAHWCDDER